MIENNFTVKTSWTVLTFSTNFPVLREKSRESSIIFSDWLHNSSTFSCRSITFRRSWSNSPVKWHYNRIYYELTHHWPPVTIAPVGLAANAWSPYYCCDSSCSHFLQINYHDRLTRVCLRITMSRMSFDFSPWFYAPYAAWADAVPFRHIFPVSMHKND